MFGKVRPNMGWNLAKSELRTSKTPNSNPNTFIPITWIHIWNELTWLFLRSVQLEGVDVFKLLMDILFFFIVRSYDLTLHFRRNLWKFCWNSRFVENIIWKCVWAKIFFQCSMKVETFYKWLSAFEINRLPKLFWCLILVCYSEISKHIHKINKFWTFGNVSFQHKTKNKAN